MAYTFIDIMIHDPEGLYGRQDLIGHLASMGCDEVASEKGRLLCYVTERLDHAETEKQIRAHLGETDEIKFYDAPEDIELPGEEGTEWAWFEEVFPTFASK